MSLTAIFNSERIQKRLDGIVARVTDNLRPAAQAGIQVYYDDVKARVPARTGKLRQAIYQAYADGESDEHRAAYRVSYSKKVAFYGKFIERGTSKMAARPFIRPGYDAKRSDALEAARQRLRKGLSNDR